MLTDDELGRALSEAFAELVGKLEPSPELLQQVSGEQQRRRAVWPIRSGRRWLAAIPAGLAAGIAAVVVFLSSSGVTPSFAVTMNSDGSILVTIDDLAGVSGANARLRQLGAPIVVVPISATCTAKVDLSYVGVNELPKPTISLIPSGIPAGTTVVLAANQVGPNNFQMAIGRVTGPPPTCAPPGSAGPGIGPSVGQGTTQP
jgi:hypothetical protein